MNPNKMSYITDSPLSSILVVLILGLTFLQSKAMQYQEPLDINDLENLFGEDGCIDGTLSATEFGSPLINSVSFTESEHSFASKTGEKNASSNNFGDKSPMSLISELATFNNIKVQYTLTHEEGPSHKKNFFVSLNLGEEQYQAEGSSIKKAQHEAARLALNSTMYEHPPKKPKTDKPLKFKSTPVQKLNEWAAKHGDARVTYSYMQQSHFQPFHHHKNYYHKGMYTKEKNVHKVTVRIEDQEFTGEGPTSQAAKQDGASKALKQLQSAEGFCMFDDSEKNLLTKLFEFDSNNNSPVSLVFDFASKSKQAASFDLVSEEGPAHIKRFVFKCSVGDSFQSFGEGSSKKAAKSEAAKSMIQKLKSHVSYNPVSCSGPLMRSKKPKKKKSKNLIKSASNSYSEEEVSYSFSDDKNPISQLMEIQQAKHDVEPIFRLVEERGQTNKEFFMEVSVGDLTYVGSGPNKKAAKRKAAEGMLEKLGYSSSGKTRSSSSEHKRKEFTEDYTVKKRSLGPGLNLNSDKFVKLDDRKSSLQSEAKRKKTNLKDTSSNKLNNNNNEKPRAPDESDKKSSDQRPKKQFVQLAQQLGFRFQFSDFPKGDKSGFVSLISLTTDPPKVCFGTGPTSEQSQDKAALTALQALHKNQVDLISKMLKQRATEAPVKEELYAVIEKDLLKIIVTKETD